MRQGQRVLAIRAALVVVVLALVGGLGAVCGAPVGRAEAQTGPGPAEAVGPRGETLTDDNQ